MGAGASPIAGFTGGLLGSSLLGSMGGKGGNSPAPLPSPLPSHLPNLGPGSTMPMKPSGAFMPINKGGGYYNMLANNSAGQLFNPATPVGGGKGAHINPMMKYNPSILDRSRL